MYVWNHFEREQIPRKFSAQAEVTLEVLEQTFLSSSPSATGSSDGGEGSEESLTTNLTAAAPVRLSQMDITKRCQGLVWENMAS